MRVMRDELLGRLLSVCRRFEGSVSSFHAKHLRKSAANDVNKKPDRTTFRLTMGLSSKILT